MKYLKMINLKMYQLILGYKWNIKMKIFEKKIRSIAYSIKDEFIKKYVLEFFLEKISSLTPNANQNKNKTFYKKVKSLKSTQKYFNETKNLSSIEIKEFSFLYLIINNLELVKNNLNLLENVKLFSNENKIIISSINGKISPLFCFYHRDCLVHFEKAFSVDNYTLTDVISPLNPEVVDLSHFSMELTNINTQEQLHQVLNN